jgi:GH24 family phage-related lysozyme (muramidase)
MDRLLVCAAYWIVANRYHSGQSSKGYAKLSQLARMGYRPGLASWEHNCGSEERDAAARLLARRRREIRLEW